MLRLLGQSRLLDLTWGATIMANGNNITLAGDTSRRVMMGRLESRLENPESRTDLKIADLVDHVLQHRARYVTLALTILRSYTSHGSPDAGLGRWGSFEAWSRLIPHAIVYSGGEDPMKCRPSGDAAHDDASRSLATILERLPQLSSDPIAVRDIIRSLYPIGLTPTTPDGHDDLRDALEALAPPARAGTAPAPVRLGNALKRFVGRVIGGKKLSKVLDSNSNSQKYVIEAA